MVRNALNSIRELNYDNWELAFIDDGSKDYPGRPVVEEILKDYLPRIRFYNTGDTVEDKYRNLGSRHGLFITQAVLNSDADITFTLCDDDAITKDYLNGVNRYFSDNPEKMWGYSHIVAFDPTVQDYHAVTDSNHALNRFTGPISPSCALDSSQVAYRTDCIKHGGIRWNYPQTGALDCAFFEAMYHKYGDCHFMHCVGQYKGCFSDQMTYRSDYTIKIH
jgi:glycosyltransferase involved in cell wall biosynthesis